MTNAYMATAPWQWGTVRCRVAAVAAAELDARCADRLHPRVALTECGPAASNVAVATSSMNVDPALVRACQRGEPGSMDALVRGTYADVYALSRRLLGNPEEAAD